MSDWLIFWIFTWFSCQENGLGNPSAIEADNQPIDVVLWVSVDGLRPFSSLPNALTGFEQIEHGWADANWRLPSMVSALLGRPVYGHGWDSPKPNVQRLNGGAYPPLPQGSTLAQLFKDNGFYTFGLVGNSGVFIDQMDRGFHEFRLIQDKQMGLLIPKLIGERSERKRIFAFLWTDALTQPLNPSVESKMRWGVDDRWLNSRQGMRHDRIGSKDVAAKSAYSRAYMAALDDVVLLIQQAMGAMPKGSGKQLTVISGTHGVELGEEGRFGTDQCWHPSVYRTAILVNGADKIPSSLSLSQLSDFFRLEMEFDRSVPWSMNRPLIHHCKGENIISDDGVSLYLHQKGTVTSLSLEPNNDTRIQVLEAHLKDLVRLQQ